ncbi:MAG: LysE family transporter [Clostridiales bacterium]|nr:LysE family transporter [Clostridiales bacterium]
MGAIFITAVAVAFSGAVMPGPLLTYTIRQALVRGPKAGFIIILGHALLELALVVLIFMGFDAILQSNAAQVAIGLVGGLLLAYMGGDMVVGALRNRVKIDLEGGGGSRGMVLSGIAISAMNPYFLLWWAIIGLGFLLQAYKGFGVWGVCVFFLGHIAVDFLWYGFVSTLIGKTRRFIGQTPYRIIVGVLGGVLLYFGITFFANAINALR